MCLKMATPRWSSFAFGFLENHPGGGGQPKKVGQAHTLLGVGCSKNILSHDGSNMVSRTAQTLLIAAPHIPKDHPTFLFDSRDETM